MQVAAVPARRAAHPRATRWLRWILTRARFADRSAMASSTATSNSSSSFAWAFCSAPLCEASAGGRAPPVPGLVMELLSEDHKAVLHVPVVGVTPPSSARLLGRDGALSYAASMDVDATNLATWIPKNHQQEPLSSPSLLDPPSFWRFGQVNHPSRFVPLLVAVLAIPRSLTFQCRASLSQTRMKWNVASQIYAGL
jgi:hypothetical protein